MKKRIHLRKFLLATVITIASVVIGCAPRFTLSPDYESNKPKTIVLLPPENTTSNNDIEYKAYPILFQELARRGYYVISPEIVKTVFIANKFENAGRINTIPVQNIGEVFGADAVMRCRVTEWSKKYVIIHTSINVGFDLELFDARTGELLWQCENVVSKSPNNNNNSILGALVSNAVSAVVGQYEPVAEENARKMTNTIPDGEYYGKW